MGVIAGVAPGRDIDVQKNDPVVLKDWNVERRLIHRHRLLFELSKRGLSEREGKNGEYENGVPHGASPGFNVRASSYNKRQPARNYRPRPPSSPGRRTLFVAERTRCAAFTKRALGKLRAVPGRNMRDFVSTSASPKRMESARAKKRNSSSPIP